MHRMIIRFTLAALAVFALSAARPAVAQSYTFQTVDAPGRDNFAISLLNSTWRNDKGLLVQEYFGPDAPVGPRGHTALLQDGVWSVIDVPGSIWCGGSNPNNRGQVAL